MSTYSYKGSLRGQLVTVESTISTRVFSKPAQGATTAEFINGPDTVGTATGALYTDGTYQFIEVVRVLASALGLPSVTTIYLQYDDVVLKTNPAYDASKDVDAPNADGSVKSGQSTGSTSTDDDNAQVSALPGKDRVPVTASDGKTVYVLVPPTGKDTTTSQTPDPNDKTKRYLTYGLYGILGLGVVALIVVLFQSFRKPVAKPITK